MNKIVEPLHVRLKKALEIRGKKPVDLAHALNTSKSAISQYLSGKTGGMDSRRLYAMCVYLGVNEAWLMGYDYPMDKAETEKRNDAIADIVLRMREDTAFFQAVESIMPLEKEKLKIIAQTASAFNSK